MKTTQRACLLLLLFLGAFGSYPATAQDKKILLHEGWMAKRSGEIPVDGTIISRADFEMTGWMEAVVPGTVLTTMLHNNMFPDPFFGMNNELIPDIYNTGAGYYTFWFRKSFSVPEADREKQVWLNFRGINYSADIFLNGHRISRDSHFGMFLRQKYLVTPYLNKSGPNVLAVIVHPPNPVGEANGGQGGDGTIARSVTQQYTPGWDWVCPVRDRNTGIWDEVSLEITGAVDLRHPFVKSRVPGVRVPGNNQNPAYINVSSELHNTSAKSIKGTLVATIDGQTLKLPVTVGPKKQITAAFPEFEIKNPRLWWPNGMGDAELNNLLLHFEYGGTISDADTISFGIRENSTYFDEETGGRVFLINGQKIFIKGGNWISSDLLLRHTPERYEAEVRMHADMNMNMIRIWGGSITERPEFYEACDKYGLLVWQDLWVTGDCNGRWFDPRKKESQARRQAYPDNHTLFIQSVADQIKMLRNHPSLYLWCGGNEYPTPPDIHAKLKDEIFPAYDGTRYYLHESTSPDLARNTIGGGGDGPYGIQNPLTFFNTPSYPFNPEIGSVGMPNVETMRKMMKEEDLTPPVDDRPNRVWQYHKYIGYGETIENFGDIKDIDDFCKKAQVVNYEQYRALQEGFNAGMWHTYTGMLVWKNQNPWTSLRGQFYDVFLDQTGGFYGYMKAASPLHIQLNLNDSSICIINQTLFNSKGLIAEATLFDIHGTLLNKQSFNLNVSANSTAIADTLELSDKPEAIYFVRLTLSNGQKEVIDENLYWLTNQPDDLRQLSDLKPVALQLSSVKKSGNKKLLTVTNNSDETAFFTRLKVINKETGEIMLPVFINDNYITLFPTEQREIEIDTSQLQNIENLSNLYIQAEPWNGSLTETEF